MQKNGVPNMNDEQHVVGEWWWTCTIGTSLFRKEESHVSLECLGPLNCDYYYVELGEVGLCICKFVCLIMDQKYARTMVVITTIYYIAKHYLCSFKT